MAGDVTIGYLKRLSYDPENPVTGGTLIAGQDYTNVYFLGGFANFTTGFQVTLVDGAGNLVLETVAGQDIIIDAIGGGALILGNAGTDVIFQASGDINLQNGGNIIFGNSGFFDANPGQAGRLDNVSIGERAPLDGTFITLVSSTLFHSISNAVAAAGTTQAGATALTSDINVISTVGSNSGVALPAGEPGMCIRIYNTGINTLKIYPLNTSGGSIDGGSANAAVTLTTANRGADFECTATNVWKSNLIGAATS